MSIGIPDMSVVDMAELKKLQSDLIFEIGVCQAFLGRIGVEIKKRRAEARVGPRDVADLPTVEVLRKPH